MDSARSPPSQTFFPSTRLSHSNPRQTSTSHSQDGASTFSTSRSPPTSRPMSSSTHLLQDLEPRTYDSQSEAESSYKDSPPTAADIGRGMKGKGKDIAQQGQQRRVTSRKWPKTRRFESRSTYNDTPVEAHDLDLRRTPRRDEQARSFADEPEEQHPLDPTPEPISRRISRDEQELPQWARSTREMPGLDREPTVKLEDVQPGWLRQQNSQEVRFSIPPPITESLILPSHHPGRSQRPKGSGETILSSIFGGFPGVGRNGNGDGGVVGRNKTSRVGDEWMDILWQERVLQESIQGLLDWQAEGLRAARTGGGGGESSVQSRSSIRSSTTLNGRHPRTVARGKRTLHAARMELLKSMYTLTDLEAAKEAVLLETSQSLEGAHKQLSNWQQKQSIADSKIRESEGGKNDRWDKELQELDALITDLEKKLKTAKERRGYVLRKSKEERSVSEAEAARWIEAKREIDRDVSRWLREPSVPGDMLEQDTYWAEFMKLNPQRRNLVVATENLGGAIRAIRKRLAGAQVERDACERGAQLWSEALEVVMKSEKTIKGWMERSLRGDGDAVEQMVEFMEEVEGELGEKLDTAEREGWNLVVCALGAEVEAWREGVEIMRAMTKGKGKQQMMGNALASEGSGRTGGEKQQEWKEMDDMGGSTAGHSGSDVDPVRRRGHSVNTQSTEDPMWGSGLDKDAEFLGELETGLGLEDNVDGPFIDQGNEGSSGGRNGMKDSQDTGTREAPDSRPAIEPEDYHGIITEGLNVSPSKSSSPAKAVLKVHENSQPSTPDREVSFRTAMEHSINVDTMLDEEFMGKEEERERVKEGSESESPEALTPREQRMNSLRKGKGVKMNGEESDDGEVPVDLLG